MPDAGPEPAHDVDLTDPATYEQGFPHDLFTALRATTPAFRHVGRHVPLTFWGTAGYQDVVAVSRDPTTFAPQPAA